MTFKVEINDTAAILKLDGMKLRARDVLKRTVTVLSIELQRYVKEKKLSGASQNARANGAKTGEGKYLGQALGVVTGRLRRSITHKVTESTGEVRGIVGTNVEYAGVHEYGFQGQVTVREHLRRTKSGNSAVVHAHARAVNLPERSFLRSALREMRPRIDEAFQAAAREVAK